MIAKNNRLNGDLMAKTSDEIIADEKRKIEQAKARIQTLLARENAKERKLDTRRKVILGGLLMDAAKKEGNWNRGLRQLIDRISRDNDRRAFEGYTPPTVTESGGHE